MTKLMKLLQETCPNVDFETCTALVDENRIDSLDIVSIITAISEEFEIEVPVEDIDPVNFNSVAAIHDMVARLQEE